GRYTSACSWVLPAIRSTRSSVAPETEHEADEYLQSFVDDHQEHRAADRHEDHQHCRDQRLPPRRPHDARGFGPYLLDEFERVGHRWTSSGGLPPNTSVARNPSVTRHS